MFLVAAEIVDSRGELPEADDSLTAFASWQFHFTERAYSMPYDFRITPAVAALQAVHDFPCLFVESGVHDIFHVYNCIRVYKQSRIRILKLRRGKLGNKFRQNNPFCSGHCARDVGDNGWV